MLLRLMQRHSHVTYFSFSCIPIQKLRGLGFDGTMSGNKSGVNLKMRYHTPSALCVHCRCHQLQLAAVHAANDHLEVQEVLGTLLTMWKTFHYSPKKAEKLAEIQAVLDAPELKIYKPSDTPWLARERCVRAVWWSLPAEAYGLAKLLCTYKFVACLYMLCDVLHTAVDQESFIRKIYCPYIQGVIDHISSRLKASDTGF